MMAALGWVIAGLLVVLAVLEFVGIYRRGKGDTITEVYRTMRDSLPQPARYALGFLVTGLLFWTALHFWDLV